MRCSIASTAASIRSEETGRFLSASIMEPRSFSRLYSTRPPPRLTIQGMASEMRSKVVKRLPQLWHCLRRRMTVPESGARESTTLVWGFWQKGQRTADLLVSSENDP